MRPRNPTGANGMAGYAIIKRQGITCKICMVKMVTIKTKYPTSETIKRRRKCPRCNARKTTIEREEK
jgi:transcriptional regulator NrdR family protein